MGADSGTFRSRHFFMVRRSEPVSTSSFTLRPSRPLRSGNFPFHRSAHGPWRNSRRNWRTEDAAQLFVQTIDLLFDRRSKLYGHGDHYNIRRRVKQSATLA